MTATPEFQIELSRLVPLDKLGEDEVREIVIASAEERAALARRFGLLALDRLEAHLRLDHGGESLIRVKGRFEAGRSLRRASSAWSRCTAIWKRLSPCSTPWPRSRRSTIL